MEQSEVKIDWSTAEVKDGQLSVEFSEETSKPWREQLERTARLLGHEEFGGVKAKKHSLRVKRVPGKQERKLQLFLEGLVQQANTACAARELDRRRDQRQTEQMREGLSRDERLTEAFRAFAAEQRAS